MNIAQRALKLKIGSVVHDVPVALSEAVASPDGGWRCTYTIAWPTGVQSGEGWGIDGIQAVELALRKIGTHLYLSPHHTAGQLYWERQGDGYGFPVPRTIHDLLVGSDKVEYGTV